MTVTIRTIAAALYQAAQDKKSKQIDGLIDNALLVMRQYGLLGQRHRLIEAVLAEHRQASGTVAVNIQTAHGLSRGQQQAISDYVRQQTGRKPELNIIEDATVIGGVKVYYDDSEIDATVSKQLQSLETHLKS